MHNLVAFLLEFAFCILSDILEFFFDFVFRTAKTSTRSEGGGNQLPPATSKQ